MATPSSVFDFKVTDLAAATFTPYKDDGSVDLAGIGACSAI
jgi:hypothetical protein